MRKHTAREYLKGACLKINHEFKRLCYGVSVDRKKKILEGKKEIDICRYIASYFGDTANLNAQGVGGHDLDVTSPTIRVEVKYLRPPARSYKNVEKDWEWLRDASAAGDEFRKRGVLIFWPSVKEGMYNITECVAVGKNDDGVYKTKDFTPFMPYVESKKAPYGENEKLYFRNESDVERSSIIELEHGKMVRTDIIGSMKDPIWCSVYTRISYNNEATNRLEKYNP